MVEEEEFENDVSALILDEGLDEEIIEEGFEVDMSENIETTTMEFGNHLINEDETRMEFDIHLINEGYHQQEQPRILPHQTNQVQARMARMRVNTDYVHYRMQVPQSIEEEAEEEDDNANEVLDQDMSEYLKTRTFCAMDTDNFNEVEEQEACAICLFDYQDKDTIGTLQCGHEFHAECINKWLQRNTSCPFCRGQFAPTTTHDCQHYSYSQQFNCSSDKYSLVSVMIIE
ncbi:hypothetical protein HAX54_018049 [Datura stramonium]|uniref:RING-type E3 ubiquitin transferase n=1 Tax=Datura stramonium TaxID=4076 RepID=A0ABS8S1C4_DATST|nr:hypothetical protein [Datura stramonium]